MQSPSDPELARLLSVACARWECEAHAIPGADRLNDPNILFTRGDRNALAVAHARAVKRPWQGRASFTCSPNLWLRGRFLACSLPFLILVDAPDGLYFATIKDFERDGTHHQAGLGVEECWSIPASSFKELTNHVQE